MLSTTLCDRRAHTTEPKRKRDLRASAEKKVLPWSLARGYVAKNWKLKKCGFLALFPIPKGIEMENKDPLLFSQVVTQSFLLVDNSRMKRCWLSCWGRTEEDLSRGRLRKRKRTDPVIIEARQKEDNDWTRRVTDGYLVLRVTSNPVEFAASNIVVLSIIDVGEKDILVAIPMFVHKIPKDGLSLHTMNAIHRPMRCVLFSGFRKHSNGYDIAFPYDARTPLVQEFVAAVRARLMKQFPEIVQVEALSSSRL
jgi:hypothetical protein